MSRGNWYGNLGKTFIEKDDKGKEIVVGIKAPHEGYPRLLVKGDTQEAKRLIEKRIRNLSKRNLDERGKRKLDYLKKLLH